MGQYQPYTKDYTVFHGIWRSFQQCKERRVWAKLEVETCNGEEQISFTARTPVPTIYPTPGRYRPRRQRQPPTTRRQKAAFPHDFSSQNRAPASPGDDQHKPPHAATSMLPTPTEDLPVTGRPPLLATGDHPIPVPTNTEDLPVTTAADGFTLVRRRKGPARSRRDQIRGSNRPFSSPLSHGPPPQVASNPTSLNPGCPKPAVPGLNQATLPEPADPPTNLNPSCPAALILNQATGPDPADPLTNLHPGCLAVPGPNPSPTTDPTSPPTLRPRKRSRCMLQVDGPQEDHEDDDDTEEDVEDDDDCELSSEPIVAASSGIQATCLGCRQECRLAQNLECNICREKLKVNFYGRNITIDCKSCKTYSNRRL